MEVMETENEQNAFECYLGNLDPVWCPGCGDFSVLGAFIEAVLPRDLPCHSAVHFKIGGHDGTRI